MKIRLFALVSCVAFGLGACGDDDGGATDAQSTADANVDSSTPDASGPDANTTMPATLRDTGLYSDWDNEVLATGVSEFQPKYVLWTDGATKRRWVYIPSGGQIDTTNMDYWELPVGTKLWKEFSRDGMRIETRLLQKNGADDWFMMAYAWNDTQDEAVAVEDGVNNAMGTNHDIPNTSDCNNCHGKIGDVALGFSALQLSHSNGGLNIDDLITAGSFTTDPPSGGYTIPGDGTIEPVLGYLHANCGGCHHETSPLLAAVPMVLRVNSDDNSVNQTGTYSTAVCATPTLNVGGATHIVNPSDPATSALRIRMNLRTPQQMPPVGTEDVDTTGLAAVDAWINSLSPCPQP